MTDLWLSLLPILLAMMISPARTLIVIMLLHTPRASFTAFAYVCGMLVSMMFQGILFGVLFSVVGLTMADSGPELTTLVSVLFVLIGCILLAGASKFIFQQPDGDKKAPAWLDKVEQANPSQAFKTGIGWLIVSPKQWAFVLTAVAVIFTAGLSPAASLINYLIFSILIQLVYFIIILINIIMPERSGAILDYIFSWIKENFKPVVIAVFGGLGLFFLIKGITSLLS
jgi:threonine/homoserine/homoserine lactone efflux protein